MCGLLTVICSPGRFSERQVSSALDTILHRGPDAKQLVKLNEGVFDVWMGHVRLAIVDLTDTGSQPMEFGSLVGVFNGEIYNHRDLRVSISQAYRGTSDTETLLAGILAEGESFLQKCNGMFAFTIYNKSEKSLLLARDRVGKKPLYVYKDSRTLIASSELKPIISLIGDLQINEEALGEFRQFGFILGTPSIFKNVTRFPAGSFAKVALNIDQIPEVSPIQFWDPFDSYARRSNLSYSDAIDALLELLDDATRLRMMSDVPVGIFLSGGVDSSLIASSIRHQNFNVTAYTAKFESRQYDESNVAIALGQHLNLSVKVLPITEDQFIRQRQALARHFDEPFADSSQIPTMALSEAASKHVKVVLTGDGGDEPFLGYPRYNYPRNLMRILSVLDCIPGGRAAARSALGFHTVDSILTWALKALRMNASHLDSKKNRLRAILNVGDFWEIYSLIMSVGGRDGQSRHTKVNDILRGNYPKYSWDNLTDRTQSEALSAVDLVGYLRDDVLVKSDRSSMAYGLELRSPFLDYRVIEFAHSLPHEYKAHGSVCKRILRDALARRAPRSVAKLPKRGLSTPIPKLVEARSGDNLSDWIVAVERDWRQYYGY